MSVKSEINEPFEKKTISDLFAVFILVVVCRSGCP